MSITRARSVFSTVLLGLAGCSINVSLGVPEHTDEPAPVGNSVVANSVGDTASVKTYPIRLPAPTTEQASSAAKLVSTPPSTAVNPQIATANFAGEPAETTATPDSAKQSAPTSKTPPAGKATANADDEVATEQATSTTTDSGDAVQQTSAVRPAGLPADGELTSAETSPALTTPPPAPATVEPAATQETQIDLDDASASEGSIYPVDLPNVLRLAGANNWSIRLATERIRQAHAQLDAAEVLWLPNLNAGIGYTKHDGQIQSTPGRVIDVSRNSLFVGGGAKVSEFPLAGGSGGPARMFVDLSLADAIFEPLAARQVVSARNANQNATFNDTLMSAALAYIDLQHAQGSLAVAKQSHADALKIQDLTGAFVQAGKGAGADTARAEVEVHNRHQEIVKRQLAVDVNSATLTRILQLQPGTELRSLEGLPVQIQLVDEASELHALIAHGQSARPEISEQQCLQAEAQTRNRAEHLRPFIPNLYLGASGGAFGGGINGNVPQLDGRADFDALAVWEIRNLGLGTRARRHERQSLLRQASLALHQTYDQVAMEVTQAYHQVHAQQMQIAIARTRLESAQKAYTSGLARIQGLEGLPLEAQQSFKALADARAQHLQTLMDYNRAQVRLLRAIGQSMTTAQ